MESSRTLSDAARRRGLAVILVDTFFMWGGFFMVVPLISVHYVDGPQSFTADDVAALDRAKARIARLIGLDSSE